MRKNLAITLPEYDRVFRVVHSVSRSLDDRPGASCLFYNTIGALLLEKSLGVRARPMMGAALFRVDDSTNTALAFATINNENGICDSTEESFHCWVETENHIVDFTAPVYREYLAKIGSTQELPRRMFQKRKADMARSHNQLHSEGDYFVQPNAYLTKLFLEKASRSPATGDLANVCLQWFVRPPKVMRDSLTMMNDLGELIVVRQTSLRMTGAW